MASIGNTMPQLLHHDGNWAQAELAQSDCDHGNVGLGTKQLERICETISS